MRRTGLLAPDPAKRVVRASVADHHVVRGALASLKGSADLTNLAPKVLNQGLSSTCWAHSAATLLYTRQNALGRARALQSPLYYAQIVYGLYRATKAPEGAPLPPLLDQGAQLDDADKAFGSWGSVRFQDPQQDLETDVPATETASGDPIPLPETSLPMIQAGQAGLFSGPYDITPNSAASTVVAACLDQNIPVWMGGLVGSNLDNYQAGTVEQPCDPNDPNAGGHARAILGYRTSGSDLQFLIRNSWGAAWGDQGNSWASSAVISGSWALLPFQVSP